MGFRLLNNIEWRREVIPRRHLHGATGRHDGVFAFCVAQADADAIFWCRHCELVVWTAMSFPILLLK
jgi:hypothetical protein